MHDVSGAARRSVELSALRYAVVDVETTGSSAYVGDRIMEVAVVHVRVDPKATRLSGGVYLR